MKRTKAAMRDGAQIEVLRIDARGPRRGGVVLLQEIFGLTEHIEEQCALFSRSGFDVVAPALFDRERPGLRLSYSDTDVAEAVSVLRSHPFDQSVSDATECATWLRESGPVFMVGYCYGGSVTYASACKSTVLAAASCYYGGMLPKLANIAPLCPTVVHLGRHDREIPVNETVEQLAHHANVKPFVYSAGHGFNSDRRADHDATSALQAFNRTLALFRAHA